MRRVEVLIVVGIISIVLALFVSFAQKARDRALQMETTNGMKQVLLSVHMFSDAYGHFPAPAIFDPTEKPLLSWRIMTVPYIESTRVPFQERFSLEEPWDSEHNIKNLNEFSHYFGLTQVGPALPGDTHFQTFVGPGTAFELRLPPKTVYKMQVGLGKDEFPDGLDNTIFIVEARNPVPWTKPQDLAYAADQPLPPIGLQYQTTSLQGTQMRKVPTFLAGFGGGAVRPLSIDMDEGELRQLINRNDQGKQ